MPIYHFLRDVLEWLREHQIPATRALQDICNDPAIRTETKDLMREPGIFNEGIPPWLVTIFANWGLSEEEIAHIEEWPDDQKEALRAELSYVYDNEVPINFAWDISRDNQAKMDISADDNGVSLVVFYSPRNSLVESGPGSSA